MMSSVPLVLATALTVAACSSMNPTTWFGPDHLQIVSNDLKTALANDPVVVSKSGDQVTITSSADYIYPPGGWQLRPGAPVLSKMTPTLSRLHHTGIAVNGYTDTTPVGPKLQQMGIKNNVDLSLKRAGAAVAYFVKHGVDKNVLTANGYGENNPVASNDTAEDRAKNRRIEITLTGDGT